MPIRVLSVPSGHVYVRHLSAPGSTVLRLPDPGTRGDPAAPWWPPPALDAAWVRAHASEFDVAHLHFGFDARGPHELRAWVAALRAARRPFVFTVHDLLNPHHADRSVHDAQLDVLVPAADQIITLTPGAAREILRRWGREAAVLPHPHVVDEDWLRAPRPQRDDFLVGVHCKSLRAGMDPGPVIDVLVDEVASMPRASLRVDVHTDVMTPGERHHDPRLARRLARLAEDGAIRLEIHDYFSDHDLWTYLRELDVSVLPYRAGTHSGWLEMCHDLGTTVLAPDCGYYAEQRPCLSYGLDRDRFDAESLRRAIRTAHADRPTWRASPAARRAERAMLDRTHEQIYRDVIGRVTGERSARTLLA